MQSPTIRTKRFLLRPWNMDDLDAFAQMNADPKVMEYFPKTLNREESRQLLEKFIDHFNKFGFGWWAATLLESCECIGFIGLVHVNFSAPFTPAVEIGWRLAFNHWGKGYATEGAKAVLQYGFDTLKLQEIVSFTAVQNMSSRHVMEKIGMLHNAQDDFDHPKLPEGHWLRRHVLYRLKKKEKYVFEPYDEIFPKLFETEKLRILSYVNNILQIEHVGSTAVPGLGGKGIIDIAIITEKKEMTTVLNSLQNLGYEFKPFFNTPDHLYFVAKLPDPKDGIRRYHIHLTYPDSPVCEELIGVRDYLIKNPEAKKEYATLKEQAVKNNQEGEEYRKIKDPFLKKILKNIRQK